MAGTDLEVGVAHLVGPRVHDARHVKTRCLGPRVPEVFGERVAIHHTALSDQGSHPPYIRHGFYCLKGRESRSAVFTVPDVSVLPYACLTMYLVTYAQQSED